jgi:hypothetical protein
MNMKILKLIKVSVNSISCSACKPAWVASMLSFITIATTASAQIMTTEMTFSTPAENGTDAEVEMDFYPERASGILKLYASGDQITEILDLPTKIGRRWDPRLQTGFLHVDAFTQYNEPRNRIGAGASNEQMALYFDKINDSNIPGTFYMIFRPTDGWTHANRRTLTGTGSTNWSYFRLWVHQNSDVLRFDYEKKQNAPASKCQITIDTTWSTNTWYFTAISWKPGEEPVLYLREMSVRGPDESPAGLRGVLTEDEGYDSVVSSGNNKMPFVRPLSIGAYYYDPGNNGGLVDGAAAHIAWFRLDHGLSSYEQIEDVFNSLGAPDDASLVIIK